jgi:hypothetical protein
MGASNLHGQQTGGKSLETESNLVALKFDVEITILSGYDFPTFDRYSEVFSLLVTFIHFIYFVFLFLFFP